MATQQQINAVLYPTENWRWNADAPLGATVYVTFSFQMGIPSYGAASDYPGFRPLNSVERAEARAIIAQWSADTGIEFIEVADWVGGDIQIGMINFTGTAFDGFSGYAYGPYASREYDSQGPSQHGDIFLNTTRLNGGELSEPWGRDLLGHELGHAIGMKHPHDGTPNLPSADDKTSVTIMSYQRDYTSNGAPRALDVAAIQYLYGFGGQSHAWNAAALELTVFGTAALDSVVGTRFRDVMFGSDGGDSLYGQGGNDALYGGADGDLILGEGGIDTIFGGAGADIIHGGADHDVLFGDTGDDYVHTGNAPWAYEGLSSSNWAEGGAGNDFVIGDRGDETLLGDGFNGETGNDYIAGHAGIDVLYGGPGDDTLFAYLQNASSYSSQDSFNWLQGDAGNDYLAGSNGNDILIGDDFAAAAGADTLIGGGGDNTIIGGPGGDFILIGDPNNPSGYYTASWAQGDAGADIINGAGGDDTIVPGGFVANLDRDLAHGADGNDLIVQGAGSGSLYGDAGEDEIWGGAFADWISGGEGSDDLYGLGGSDIFQFDAIDFVYFEADRILDFSPGDFIVFTGGLTSADLTFDLTSDGLFIGINGPYDHTIMVAGVTDLAAFQDDYGFL